MADPLHHYIVPVPAAEVEEVLLGHQVAFEFYGEVHHRQAFEEYCRWYEAIAAQHQQDLAAMRRELNLMGWFNARRGGRAGQRQSV